jgi:hypothetical protein
MARERATPWSSINTVTLQKTMQGDIFAHFIATGEVEHAIPTFYKQVQIRTPDGERI